VGEGRQAGRSGAVPSGGVYRPRNPRVSPLYQWAARHTDELREAGRFHRAVEEEAVERFLECGDPNFGFSRIHGDSCGHDYLLAIPFKTRNSCPSHGQKCVIAYDEWIEEAVVALVACRQ